MTNSIAGHRRASFLRRGRPSAYRECLLIKWIERLAKNDRPRGDHHNAREESDCENGGFPTTQSAARKIEDAFIIPATQRGPAAPRRPLCSVTKRELPKRGDSPQVSIFFHRGGRRGTRRRSV